MHQRLHRSLFIGAERHLAIIRRPLSTFGLHAHDYFEIELILAGKGTQLLNGEKSPLERGSVSVLTPTDFHQVEAGALPSCSWNISFDETMIPPRYLAALYSRKAPFRILSEETLQKADAAAGLLLKEADHEVSARPLLEYLLSLLIAPAKEEEPLSPMGRALLFIENHFRENPSLADAAKEAHLSPGYFGALFKKTPGETYIQYLSARKVRCAEMLLKGGVRVADACFASGFGSLSGFLYTFKKNVGTPPKYYLKDK